jgi:phage terminase large subunit-like protein
MPSQSRRPARKGKNSRGAVSLLDCVRRGAFARLPHVEIEIDGEIHEFDDYPAIAKGYAEAVAKGKIPACKLLKAAAQRYLDMLGMAAKRGNEFYFSPEHVIDRCSMMERIKHHEDGQWKFVQFDENGDVDPYVRLEPWQIWIESATQGFRRALTGERLVTTALEVMPRKNDKTGRLARTALVELCVGGDTAAQIPIAATTERQALETIFGGILKICSANPELVEEFKLNVTSKQIRFGSSSIFILTSLGEKQDGLNPSLAVFEEGHSGQSSVYKVVRSAFGARPGQQLRMITTAGQRPEGPAYMLIKEAEMILLGASVDWSFFAAIYTLDREDYQDPETKAIDWARLLNDESLIAKANPMYGISLDPVSLRNQHAQAIRRPDLRPEIARTRFNIWSTEGSSLIDMSAWMACKADILLEDFIGAKCWIGVDLATKLDLCAITLLFELPNDTIAMFSKAFIPEGSPTVLDPEFGDQLRAWAEEGWITFTEGVTADHDRIEMEIEAFCDVFEVLAIGCDPAQAHNTINHLWDGRRPVYEYANNANTMTAPTDDILGRVASKKILHDGNPVLAWNATNAHGERRGNGSIMPRKDKKNDKRKIDGFIAGCIANGCRMQPDLAKNPHTESGKPTVDPYKERGLIGYQETADG